MKVLKLKKLRTKKQDSEAAAKDYKKNKLLKLIKL